MNTTIKAALSVLCIILIGCGQKTEPAEKYCGLEIPGFEVINLKSLGDKGYEYSDADNKLAGDIMDVVKENFNTDVKLAFVKRDDAEIAMYIIGPSDQGVVEKISCYLLENDFDSRLPAKRSLLFYTDDHSSLVAAVKSKEKE